MQGMRANLLPMWIVLRREARDQLRDWRIISPIILLTLFFPGLMNFTAKEVLEFVNEYGATIIGERFIPFLLMIVGFFPITISLVIALESFAGETERHTIEPLLSSPLEDWQLYTGKLLASLIAPLIASYFGIVIYLIGVFRSTDWRPEPAFLVQMLLLNAVQALVMVSGATVISTQTTSVRAANLLASFIIIPMALLIQGESVMMLWADYPILWWAVLGQGIIAMLLIRLGLTHFNREELLGREIDTLNLRWGWGILRKSFSGGAHGLRQWYNQQVRRVLRQLSLPSLLMSALLLGGMVIGASEVNKLGITPEMLNLEELRGMDASYLQQMRQFGFFSAGGVAFVWLHNLRVVGIASLVGMISFGVLGTLVMILPMVLIGFLTGLAAQSGISATVFMTAFLFPHGLLEIPAMILAGAGILRLGATFITPARTVTIGEAAWRAIADWCVLTVGVVLPLFLGAACLEVFITPQIALRLLGGG